MSSQDMSQYLDIFLDEGRESLAVLETNFLCMERGDQSPEMLATIFRAAHTLKGSSRAMGFMAIGNLTHEMENILDEMRKGQLSVSTAIVNALLECLDTLQTMMEGVAATGSDSETRGKDIDGLIAMLTQLRSQETTPAASAPAEQSAAIGEQQLTQINEAVSDGACIYTVRVGLHPDCMMKSVRAIMVLSALREIGSVIAASPTEQQLDVDEIGETFEVIFASAKAASEVEDVLKKISEITTILVATWTGEGVAPAPAGVEMKLSEYELTSIRDAKENGAQIYNIHIELHSECAMKSVRVHMVLAVLAALGAVLVASPKEEYLDAEEFGNSFALIYATDNGIDEIEKSVLKISEIVAVSVTPWNDIEKLDPAPRASNAATAAPSAQDAAAAASAPQPAATPAAAAPATHAQAQTIRVDVTRLDILLNLIGELVIDRTQIARMATDLHTRYPQDENLAHLIEATHRVARITGELQEEIMKTRMLPIDGVFQRMPRMIRDLAQKTGKDVDFQVWGGETELDRSVLEVLGDPLIHLLRNSIDHGLETPDERKLAGKPRKGVVTLSARHQENHILIEITDDGRGMDPTKLKDAAVRKGILTDSAAEAMTDRDALNLIFASGFSTAASLTDISGRGVGMDIVKSNLEKIGGRILIESHLGKGSTFTIHLPLTLAIVRALLVCACGGTYVVPLGSVVEMLRLGTEDGEVRKRSVSGQAAIVLRGRTIPLVNLGELLTGIPEATNIDHIDDNAYVVIIGFAEKLVGLCVDDLVGEQEVVIKSLGKLLGDISGLSGATILGDGSVALIIDPVRALECLCELSEAASNVPTKPTSSKVARTRTTSREKELVG